MELPSICGSQNTVTPGTRSQEDEDDDAAASLSHLVRKRASYFPAQNTSTARGGDCHQFRAFKESTTYGRIRTRNWLTVPSHHAVSPFCAGK